MITDLKLHQKIANEYIIDSNPIPFTKDKSVCWYDPSTVRFTKFNMSEEYPKNMLLIEGKELSEDDLNLSFIQWERLFGYHRNSFYQLSHMYDKENCLPVGDIRLRWDSKEIVNWKCIFGHKWKKSVYDYTHPTWPKQFCPVCQAKIVGLGFFDNDGVIKRNIEKIMYMMEYYKTYDLDDLLYYIDLDLVNLESIILHSSQDNPWINKRMTPKTLDFYFAYPDGKRGDISRVIANNGILTELEYNEYKCTISTEYYKEIEVLASYYCNARFGEKSNTVITSSMFENYIRFGTMVFEDAISSFMFHNHMLYKYLALCGIKYIYRSVLPQRCPSNADDYISDRIAPFIYDYRKRIKKLSEELRNIAVEQKIASSKWNSEQKLFRIVKKHYSDAIFQYQDVWLGAQSLDIFIPSIKVGLEYQGKQHYLPVEVFGGKEGFDAQQERDKRKRELCIKNGVKLIEWRYDNTLSEKKVYERIEEEKQKRP